MKNFTESELVYPSEKKLFIASAIFASIFWIALTIFTIGIGLLYVGLLALVITIGHGIFLASIKGYGLKITKDQLPEVYKVAEATAKRMEMDEVPDIYLYHMNGMLNAFATHFFSRNFIILTSEMMDACDKDPKKWAFILGHEMAHLKRKHTRRMGFLAPSRIIPFIGGAYSRACEYTCDAYGAYYGSESVEEGVKAVQMLAAGNADRANAINWEAYENQVRENRGMFSTLVEVGASHPFTAKRSMHLRRLLGEETIAPVKHSFWGLFWAALSSWQIILLVYVALFGGLIIQSLHKYKEAASLVPQVAPSYALPTDYDYTEESYSLEAETACADLYDVYLDTEYDSPEEEIALDAYNKCAEDFDSANE